MGAHSTHTHTHCHKRDLQTAIAHSTIRGDSFSCYHTVLPDWRTTGVSSIIKILHLFIYYLVFHIICCLLCKILALNLHSTLYHYGIIYHHILCIYIIYYRTLCIIVIRLRSKKSETITIYYCANGK